ncbi:MAG TPA: apolipoprotein N-acyltransferase [Oceanospirillaceae bacterium]|nr:apolipoprotein N-acyltransferase [Oceanospirillaceae bacterium]
MAGLRNFLPVFVLALIAGGVAPLALAPVAWWPVAALSIATFYLLLNKLQTMSESLAIGLAYGAGYFFVGVSWVYVSMVDHAATPAPIAALFTLLFCLGFSLYYLLFAYLYRRFLQQLSTPVKLIAFASLWLALDLLRGWLLTGFPWLYIGYSGLGTWLAGYGPVVGQHGMTWLLVISTLALVQVKDHIRYLAIPIVVAIGGWGLQQIAWTEPAGERQITLLQGNVSLDKKWQRGQLGQSLEYYFSRTYSHLDSDLVIWPETAVATYWDNVQEAAESLSELAAQQNTVIITGTVLRNKPERGADYYNGLVAFGAEQGAYAKQRLVPFGEYVPLEGWLRGVMQLFNLPMSQFRLAPIEQGLLTSSTTAIAGNICYEIAYSGLVAKQAKDAQLIVTVSNDSWFGNTWAPWQHLQMAQMRALENGRPVARATNSGVSALIDYQGNLTKQLPQFVESELTGTLQLRTGRTPFSYLMSR